MTYLLKHYNGTDLGTINTLENNGPGNQSVSREIADVVFGDLIFGTPVDSFVLSGDLTYLTEGQQIEVSDSVYMGVYTVSRGAGDPAGTAVAVVANGKTHLPIAQHIQLPMIPITGATEGQNGSFLVGPVSDGQFTFLPDTSFVVQGNSFADANITYTVASAETSSAYNVTSVDIGFSKFVLPVAVARFFKIGLPFNVTGTPNSIGDGQYTVQSVVEGVSTTEITVNEAIPAGTTVTTQTRISQVVPLTLITVSGVVPIGVQSDGMITPQAPVALPFAAPTTISASGTQRLFNVVYNIADDYTTMLIPGTPVQVKLASVDSQVTSFVTRVKSTAFLQPTVAYPDGVTQVTTEYVNSTSVTPVIITDTNASLVFPAPAVPFGYLTYATTETYSALKLVGTGVSRYNSDTSWGQALQENLINLHTHFYGDIPPVAPLTGSLWFDTDFPALRVKIDNTLAIIGVTPGADGVGVWSVDAVEGDVGAAGDTIMVYDNTMYGNGAVFQITALISEPTDTPSGATTHITVTPAIDISAATQGTNSSAPFGKLYNVTRMHGVVIAGIPVTDNIDMDGLLINNLGDAVVDSDAVSRGYADTRYVNVTGDTMSGSLDMGNNSIINLSNPAASGDAVNLGYADANYVNVTGDTMTGALTLTSSVLNMVDGDISMQGNADLIFDSLGAGTVTINGSGGISINGAGSIKVSSGKINLGTTATNTAILANNGAAAPTLTFNTTTATVTTGNAVVDLGGNKITNGSTPTVSSDLVNKQYVDDRVNGIMWITPILDPNLFADNLSTPPVIPAGDTLIPYHRTYIVNGTGTGAWAGFNGHAMYYDAVSSSWKSVLGRPVAIGDRFGVFIEPDDDDTLATPTSGGLTGLAGKIVTIASVAPYTYTSYTPAEPDAVSVKGNATGSSPHVGHSYTFRGTWGTGAYGTNYRWIEFSGPQMLTDGAGLRYTGNVLNVGAGTGVVVGADTVSFDNTFGDARYVTKAVSSVLSSNVNLTFSGGEVLGLPALPSTQGSAASKKYVDDQLITARTNTLNGDAFWNNVVLLLHADGANNSTTVIDSSISAKTITVTGDAKISTVQSKFGGSALVFDGAGDRVRTPQHVDFQIFGGDFTVELWAFYASTVGNQPIFQFDSGISSNRLNLSLLDGTIKLYSEVGAVGNLIVATPPAVNEWNHIALVRSAGTITLYLNGQSVGTTTNTSLPTGNLFFSLGATSSSGGVEYYAGYLDDIRVTKGVARYATAFTPPTTAFANTPVSDVSGPSSAVNLDIALFDGTTGKIIKDSGVLISTDGTLASNVDTKVPTEKAAKTYIDTTAVTVGTGGNSVDISTTNLNSLAKTGFYRGSALTNAPDGGWFYIIHQQHTLGGYAKQTATAFELGGGGTNTVIGGTTYIRTCENSVWKPWKKVILDADLTAAITAAQTTVVTPKSLDYTLALTDANTMLYHPTTDTTARTWTIPANAAVAFPIGTSITFDNDAGAGAITIAITTDTLVLVGAGTTGSRTLAAGGQAKAVKVTATRWRISGTGLT